MKQGKLKLFCLCGPSGVGKSTVCRELLKKSLNLLLSVSATTRPPRPGEIEGEHYYFVTKEQFESRIAENKFLEWAKYNEQYYGTPADNLRIAEEQNKHLLLDIDVQGATTLKKALGAQVVVIFISPPTFEDLRKRLESRAADSPDTISQRLKRGEEEIHLLSDPALTDFTIINQDLAQTLNETVQVIRNASQAA